MAIADVFDALDYMTESLSTTIKRKATWESPLIGIIPTAEFKLGTGLVQTTYEMQNSEPDTEEESWAQATTSDGNNNTGQGGCATTYNDAYIGFEQDTYRPYKFGLKGPTLCRDDFKYSFNSTQFVTGYVEELKKRSKRSIEKRYSSIYNQLAQKFVVTGTTEEGYVQTKGKGKPSSEWTGSSFTNTGLLAGVSLINLQPATQYINQEFLDGVALQLMYEGATNPDSNGFITLGPEGPVWPLEISPSASKRVIKSDADNRNDIRYGEPNELLKRMGAIRTHKNFRHVPNLFPDRYWYSFFVAAGGTISSTTTLTGALGAFSNASVGQPVSGTAGTGSIAVGTTVAAVSADGSILTLSTAGTNGTVTNVKVGDTTLASASDNRYTKVPTWKMINSVSGKGKKAALRDEWVNAKFETAKVLNPKVFTAEWVRPVTSVASLNWEAGSRMGDWVWKTGLSQLDQTNTTVQDPFNKYGAHYAEFEFAPRPDFINHGAVIFFKRF